MKTNKKKSTRAGKAALLRKWIGNGSPLETVMVDGKPVTLSRGRVMWMQLEAIGLGISLESLLRLRLVLLNQRN